MLRPTERHYHPDLVDLWRKRTKVWTKQRHERYVVPVITKIDVKGFG